MVLGLIVQELKTTVAANDGPPIHPKRKAITAFFPYAVWRKRDGQHELLDTLFHLFGAMVIQMRHETPPPSLSDGRMFMWCHIEPLVATLLNEESSIPLKQAIILASPYMPWKGFANNENLIQLWGAAAPSVPYANDIGQSVVSTLLRIANDTSLQPHIPVGMWSWLNKLPSLPPVCWAHFCGSTPHVVRVVRALGDIEILKSYLLLIWSEWEEWTSLVALDEMRASLQGDFSGLGMGPHRQDLLRQLDSVLGRLDPDLEHVHPNLNTHVIQRMKEEYGKLREVLLEVDREAAVARIRELPD